MLRQVSLQNVAHLVKAAPVGLLLVAGGAAGVFNLIRAVRYRILLASAEKIPIARMTGISTTAWAISLALPSVFGDAAFVWLLRRGTGLGITRGGAAALLSRAADVTSFVLIVMLASPFLGVHLAPAVKVAVSLVGVGVLVVMLALVTSGPRRALLEMARRFPRLAGPTDRVEGALAGMSRRPTLLGLTATTLLARACSAIEYMALFAALGAPLGFWQASFAVSIRTLFLAVPVQGVGGLGTTQLWWTTSLLLLGRPLSSALVTGIAIHVLDLAVSVPVAIIGVMLLAFAGRSTGSRRWPLRRWANRAWPLVPVALFALLRLPSFFEPHWYTDEAGYATTARAVIGGSRIYSEAWTNKPPLHIFSVALPFWLFGPNEAALHFLTFLTGLCALLAVVYIARRNLGTRGALIVSAVFAVVIGLPFVDAELGVPESLMIAPTSWAAALLFVRLTGRNAATSWWTGWGWAVAAGVLTGIALGIQQTAVADASAFFIAMLVSSRISRRELVLFSLSVGAAVAAWLGIAIASAGLAQVTFSLVTFFFDYAAYSVPAPTAVLLLKALAPLLALVGVVYARRDSDPAWFFWLWACLTLEISAVANRGYPHFLAPAVAPTLLALSTLPRLLPGLRLRFAPLGAGVLVAAGFAGVATLDIKAVVAYTQWPVATITGGEEAWADLFDERTHPDADVADWIKGEGLGGSRAVVWSSDAWIYLLADLPVQLRAAPIYNDVVLYGSGGAVVRQVSVIDPDLIVTSDEALAQWPDIHSLLDTDYTLAYASTSNRVYVRRGLATMTGLATAGEVARTGPR